MSSSASPPTTGAWTPSGPAAAPPSVRLRPWQKAAFDRFIGHEARDYLAVATPGAGKTTFALTCARWALGQERRRLIVVAPTSHLKVQWAQAAHRIGLELDPDWTPGGGLAKRRPRPRHHLPTHRHRRHREGAARPGDRRVRDPRRDPPRRRREGLGRRRAPRVRARPSAPVPQRHPVPQRRRRHPVRDATRPPPRATRACSHYTYGYADALRDGGVVRPVYFPRFDGVMEWSAPDGSIISANFHDELARDQMAHRLRTALSLDGDWLPAVIRQAHDRLMAIRSAPDGPTPVAS